METQLTKKHTEPGLRRLLIDMLQGGVREYQGTERNTQWINKLISQQEGIGETKMWVGWITTTWGDIQESYLRRNKFSDKLSGTDWAKTVVSLVWRFFLETWSRRNHALHQTGKSPDIIRRLLKTEIQKIHPEVPQIKFGRKYLHKDSLEELLKKPTRYLKRWLRLGQMVTNQEQVAVVRRVKLGQDIKAYLPLLSDPPDRSSNPRVRTSAKPQEHKKQKD